MDISIYQIDGRQYVHSHVVYQIVGQVYSVPNWWTSVLCTRLLGQFIMYQIDKTSMYQIDGQQYVHGHVVYQFIGIVGQIYCVPH